MNDVTLTKENLMLEKAFKHANIALSKSYLSNLTAGEVLSMQTNNDDINLAVRFFSLGQIVNNKNENMRDKLSNVFHSVWNADGSILLLIKGKKDSTEIYIGIKNVLFDGSDDAINHTSLLSEILENNLTANFPGTKSKRDEINETHDDKALSNIDEPKLEELLRDISNSSTVASVSDIAALQSEEENKDRIFIQGIEKLIDAMNGEEYSMLLIADPVNQNDLKLAKLALESQYSQLVPFSEVQITLGENASIAAGETLTKSYTKTLSDGVTNTITHTTGTNKTISRSATAILAGAGAVAGTFIAPGMGTAIGCAAGGILGSLIGDRSEGENKSESTANATTTTTSTAEGNSEATSKTITLGKSKGVQIKTENHSIKRMLEKIDETLKRYDECADLGMWNCAMYCISDSEYVSRLAASTYQSLIRGKNSSLENGAINIWRGDNKDKIMPYLTHMSHPKIKINELEVTPGMLVSSLELAIHAGLPNKSVSGLPVIECAEFGRSVTKYNNDDSETINLGKIFHMHNEEKLLVNLSAKSLCSHAFITGSTGSGKSNTVYRLLDNLPSHVKFLVVEPAKGEYKNIFSRIAKVYGTNPSLTELLKINPFSFPEEIHVLEHIDRLIEIFNVCWPMYAAMPAVLKDAVEKSYEDVGWDLTSSTNAYGKNLYPEFSDVARNIKSIIDSSEYDAENKGAYKGSLLTRLKSLTNGLNGLIFNRNEISNEELFDKNVIVDLSRVGSAETKSLIMGVLVLKLQEYRMSSADMNSELKHITVLEEAHNLLKRTSTEQSSESANLIGKSVEMLTNAIAEMRTYGEGFIIADQAPALLDMAVIRNTNTKIIMRLPDQNDRELVGKAANLNDDQITELAKLPCGVAAVYQNEWVEPVLCKVDEFAKIESAYSHESQDEKIEQIDYSSRIEVAEILFGAKSNEMSNVDLFKKLSELNLKDATKVLIIKYLNNSPETPNMLYLAPIISELFPKIYKAFLDSYKAQLSNTKKWSIDIDEALKSEVAMNIEDSLRKDIRQCIITNYLYYELGRVEELEKWSLEGGKLA
ncbi:MAG: DUF87 domain-containing protein [Campylobacter sp.]|uniref:helicase HerA domain-containing protein n=1 Tax=Campylobacter sp. TaxID=205 RepID=UPI001B61D1D7|nr:DUF87 domain-containing protein [Campylobacter sp.]MBP3674920.1 DUF87 domain-containing protein [Campylobacter sp.]